jgi:hypothetical protein
LPTSLLLDVRQPPAVAVQCAVPVAVVASLVLAAVDPATAVAALWSVGVRPVVPELVVSQLPLLVRQSALASRALANVVIPHTCTQLPLAAVPPCEPSARVGPVLDDRHPCCPSQLASAWLRPVVLELRQSPDPVVHDAVADCRPEVALVSQPWFAPAIVHFPAALFVPEPAAALQPDDTPARPMHRSARCSPVPRSFATASHSKKAPLDPHAAPVPPDLTDGSPGPSWPVAARSSSVAS